MPKRNSKQKKALAITTEIDTNADPLASRRRMVAASTIIVAAMDDAPDVTSNNERLGALAVALVHLAVRSRNPVDTIGFVTECAQAALEEILAVTSEAQGGVAEAIVARLSRITDGTAALK